MARKSFKQALAMGGAIHNPAEALITGSAAAPAPATPVQAAPADGTGAAEEVAPKESKTRRVQSLLKPSLYAFLERSAKRKGISVNDRLNTLLEEAKAAEEEG